MRRLGIIPLCLGLVVITSCSKNIDDDIGPYTPQMEETSALVAPEGTFEGEWKLSKYEKTCEGQIEVKGNEIVFDVPADYLFPRLGFVTEDRKAMYPKEPLFTSEAALSYFNIRQVMTCSLQGYSDAANYNQLKNTWGGNVEGENSYTPIGDILFDVKIEDVEYHIALLDVKEKPTAVFDAKTGLWTVAIPIDMITITNRITGTSITSTYFDEKALDKSAWLFVFRATKRIK